MTLQSSSQINSGSIDPSYPAAGETQSSQGFRTNFYNIQAALSTAAQEITLLNGVVNSLSGASVTFTGDATSSQAISLTGQVTIDLSLSSINSQTQVFNSSLDDITMSIGTDGRVTVSSVTAITGGEQSLTPKYTTVKNSSGTSISSISIPSFKVSSTGRVDTSSISTIDIDNFGIFGYAVKANSVIYSNSAGTTDYLNVTSPYYVLMSDSNSNIVWNKLNISHLAGVEIGTPTAGQSLVYDGTNWVPTTLSGDGDNITGSNGINVAISGDNATVSLGYNNLTSGTPTTSEIIAIYNSTSSSYSAVTISQIADIIGSNSSTSLENDSSPTLSANLNLNGHNIVSNGNISIQTTSGTVSVGSLKFPSSLPSSTSVLVCDTSGNITWGTSSSTGSGTITVGAGLSLTSSSSTDEIDLAIERLQVWDAGSGTSSMNPGDMLLVYTNPLSTATQTTNPGSGNQGYCYITPSNIVNYMKGSFIYNSTLSSDLILNGHNISSGHSITISNTSPAVSGSATNISIAAGNNIYVSGSTISTTATTQANITAPTVLIEGSSSGSQGTITVTDAIQIIGDSVTVSSTGPMNVAANSLSSVVGTSVENYTSSFTQEFSGTPFITRNSTALTIGESSVATNINGQSLVVTSPETTITSTTSLLMVSDEITMGSGSNPALVIENNEIITVNVGNYSLTVNGEGTVAYSDEYTIYCSEEGAATALSFSNGSINCTSSDSGGDSVNLAIQPSSISMSCATSSNSSTITVSPTSVILSAETVQIGAAVWPVGATPVNSYLTTDSTGKLVWETIASNSSVSISKLQDDVDTNTSDISTNKTNIATNTRNIATNTANIATNTTDITNLTSRVSASETNISNITTTNNSLQTSITKLQTATSGLSTSGTSYVGQIDSSTVTVDGTATKLSTIISGIDTNLSNITDKALSAVQLSTTNSSTSDTSTVITLTGKTTSTDVVTIYLNPTQVSTTVSNGTSVSVMEISPTMIELAIAYSGTSTSESLIINGGLNYNYTAGSNKNSIVAQNGMISISSISDSKGASIICSDENIILETSNSSGSIVPVFQYNGTDAEFSESGLILNPTTSVPSSTTSAGTLGQIVFDDTNGILYRCTTTGTDGNATWEKFYSTPYAPYAANNSNGMYTSNEGYGISMGLTSNDIVTRTSSLTPNSLTVGTLTASPPGACGILGFSDSGLSLTIFDSDSHEVILGVTSGGFNYTAGGEANYRVECINGNIVLQADNGSIVVDAGQAAPSSTTDAGTKNEIRFDDSYMYRCVTGGAAGSAKWVRFPIDSTWT